MGDVYRATDTKLGREVALKVLSEELADDPDRLERFDREAKLLGALNHPNIASIYGLEESEGRRFLVLELVDGEDLSERLKRGPVPVEEAREIATQIARALEAAHERGIVHRDLKPANVKLTAEGQVKVLDFGLAKAWAGEVTANGVSSAAELSQAPTLAGKGPRVGMILGTAGYMAPEQARGRSADKRADVWAFGVVLFEMLTGQRLFTGDTVSDVLAAVLKEEPPWEKLPPHLPGALERVLRRCLQKQPRERFHDIADVRIELSEAPEIGTRTSGVARWSHRPRALLPWAVALAATGVATWFGLHSPDGPSSSRTVVASILPPAGAEFVVERGLALSPDGRQLVFAARDKEGADSLWLRTLETGAARSLAGTEEGSAPFWSPDGRYVGFFAAGKVKKVELETGLVESLAEHSGGRQSGAWSPHGEIVFSGRFYQLERVSARGGETEVLLPTRGGEERLWPTFLPDGRRFLFLARDYGDTSRQRELRVASLDGALDEAVLRINSNAVYVPSGHLVWWQDGNLRAQRCDAESLALEGEPRLLVAGVQFDASRGRGTFSVAGETLVFQAGGLLLGDELVRLSRTGEDLGPVGPPGNYYHPRLSPDGSRVVVDRSDETNRGDVWVYEMERGTGTRLTTAAEDETDPAWSPDGRRIAYWAALGENGRIRVRASGGGGDADEELSVSEDRVGPSSWSAAGLLLVERDDDLWVCALEDGSFSVLVESPFLERNPVWSADGRLFAYDSDETGHREVYIQTFPISGKRWRVSTDGGHAPAWRRDGGEIYYVTEDSTLAVVTVQQPPGTGSPEDLRLGQPRDLFRVDLKETSRRQYDTLDGETFVLNRRRRAGSRTPLTLVLNVNLEEGVPRSE